ncbi:hypothetical protein AMELA_G00200960, partial [Ameiurus melas]
TAQRSCGHKGAARRARVCRSLRRSPSRRHTEDASRSMSAFGKEHDMVCEKAVALITDLCMHESPLLEHKTCEEFLFFISNQDYSLNQPDLEPWENCARWEYTQETVPTCFQGVGRKPKNSDTRR